MNDPIITNDEPSVLIVGAGPTGLMMASQLARFDIPFRIIEKNKGPTTQSRAVLPNALTNWALGPARYLKSAL